MDETPTRAKKQAAPWATCLMFRFGSEPTQRLSSRYRENRRLRQTKPRTLNPPAIAIAQVLGSGTGSTTKKLVSEARSPGVSVKVCVMPMLVSAGGPRIVGPGRPADVDVALLPPWNGTEMLKGSANSGSVGTPSISPCSTP